MSTLAGDRKRYDGPTQTAVEVENRWDAHPVAARTVRIAIVAIPLVITFAATWLAGRHYPPDRLGLNLWVWWGLLMLLSWALLRALNHVARRFTPIAAMLQVTMIFPDEAPSRARAALRSTNGKKILREFRDAEAAGRNPPHVPSSEFLAGMLRALAEHEPLTRGHSERVRAYTDLIADELELPDDDKHKLRWAALLHDIGKLEVPAEILNARHKPSDEEWEVLKTHPTHGGRLMEPLREWLGEWSLAAEQHHMRWDGLGYPEGLAGTEISLAGRIVAVADAYDVMTSVRSYKSGMSPESARQELAKCSGTQFDPMVVRAFLAIGIGKLRAALGPFGSIVGLVETFRIPLNPGVIATAGSAAAGAAVATVGAAVGANPDLSPLALPFAEPLRVIESIVEADVDEDAAGEIVIEGSGGSGALTVTVGPARNGAVTAGVTTIQTEPGRTWSFEIDYAPAADWNGVDSFNYTICDESDDCRTGTARIAVRALNDRPTALDDRVTPTAFGAVTIEVLENDTDLDGDPLRIRSVSGGSNGTASIVGSAVRYVPDASFRGVEVLHYDIVDPDGASSTATITIDLRTLNAPPTAVADTAVVLEDATVDIDVVANDTDAEDGRPVGTITIVTAPARGDATVTPGGTVRYTPDADYHGPDSVTYRVTDSDGASSPPTSVSIAVEAVNDAPTIIPGGTITIGEDAGATAVGWASGIGPGPGESGQSVLVTVVADDPSLFIGAPTLGLDGIMTLAPAPNRIGTTTLWITLTDNGGVANGGQATTGPLPLTISVIDVNDPPTFTAGADITALEDSGPFAAPWASGISAGPASERDQALVFTVTNDNADLFSVPPALAPDGTLSFVPAPNEHGMAELTVVLLDDGGTATGGDDRSEIERLTITVEPVNDIPSFTAGPDLSVLEDSGPVSAPWATEIAPGPVEESGQSLLATVATDNAALFSVQPAIDAGGVLAFTPAPDATGSATVTVTFVDDGGTANGGWDTSDPATFTIAVIPVNDRPQFLAGPDVGVGEDSGGHSAPWATAISAGPPDETGQTVTFTTLSDDPSLFAVQPTIAADGTLTFTPAADQAGSAFVTVTLADDGGTADGGVDTSAATTFTITVAPVNDAPTFAPGADPVVVAEDSGPFSLPWATGVSAGPPDESSQALVFSAAATSPGLFAVPPAIASDGMLTFTPAGDAAGTATVTVSLVDDGGTADGGVDTSGSVTFTLVVTEVNDAPSFAAGGDVTVLEDSGGYSAPWATAISAGPPDEAGQPVAFTVVNDANALFAVQPAIASDGMLTFTPAGDAAGTATVTVSLVDDGGTADGGVDTSGSVTFTLVVTEVNDAPSFAAGGDVTVLEDSGGYSAPWATAIGAGPPSEAGQTVGFDVTTSDPGLFSEPPAVAPDGTLTFIPTPDSSGIVDVDVILRDDGGTADGGIDTSPTHTFRLVVTAVNDAPVFDVGPHQTSQNHSGPVTVPGWATNIAAGPADESHQLLTFSLTNDDPALFAVPPTVAPDGTLSYTPDPSAVGTAILTLTLADDGGTGAGGVDTSDPATFEIGIEAPHVLISELRTRGPGGISDDFVEIHNASPADVDIGGWTLHLEDSATESVSVPGSVVLVPGGYYLFAHTSFSGGASDLAFADPWESNGSVALESPLLGVIDAVALRPTAPYVEGTALPGMSAVIDQSYERLPAGFSGNCVDTDDNRADFVHNFGFSNPDTFGTVRNCAALPPATATSVVVSEFRPLGPGGADDEFVEIYNPTAAPVDVSGWKLHITSALDFDYYVFPPATVLAPGQHWLVTHPGAAIAGDDAWAGLSYGSSYGDIVLRNDAGADVDIFGYGAGPILWEGAASPSYPSSFTQTSYQRRHGGCSDVGNNTFDFILAFAADPQDSAVVTGC